MAVDLDRLAEQRRVAEAILEKLGDRIGYTRVDGNGATWVAKDGGPGNVTFGVRNWRP